MTHAAMVVLRPGERMRQPAGQMRYAAGQMRYAEMVVL